MRSAILALAMIAAPAAAVTIEDFDTFNPLTPTFSSAYTYVANTPGGNTAAGQYTVGPNANPWNGAFQSYADVTGGNYMIVNGAGTSDVVFTNNTPVALSGTGRFRVSFALSDACCNGNAFGGVDPSPPVLALRVNGVTIASNLMLTPGTVSGVWQTVSADFIKTGPTATIEIVNNNAEPAGNDYGLDAITVGVVPEPAQWALMFGGFGLLGTAARRRRQRVAVRYA